ncbi:MAG TPA: hypothetical protein VJL80_06455 [Aeromicrobium sp.]|nr:hypothetical protein [Aeromicrobium sp.]HKY57660.1 hypothetical protein [Aeromicrobium sp.]
MPTKTSNDGRAFDIDGRKLIWHPEGEDGEPGGLPDVTIPLRIKLGLVLDHAEKSFDNEGMAEFLSKLIPDQMETLREMDVNDFQDMFTTWQSEYNMLTGASLGESSRSPD